MKADLAAAQKAEAERKADHAATRCSEGEGSCQFDGDDRDKIDAAGRPRC